MSRSRIGSACLLLAVGIAASGCGGSSSKTAPGLKPLGPGLTVTVLPAKFKAHPVTGLKLTGPVPLLKFHIYSSQPARAMVTLKNQNPGASEQARAEFAQGINTVTFRGYIAEGTSNVTLNVEATAPDGTVSRVTAPVTVIK